MSLQQLINERCYYISNLPDYLTSSKGLYNMRHQQWLRMHQQHPDLPSDWRKHGLQSLTIIEDRREIRQALIRSFAPDGPKYPIIAGCRLNNVMEVRVEQYATAEDPFVIPEP
ncbi:hypothetical protein HanRHA438_Chr13g0615321 [Helianthus annuus]|nr:hypothetical protein HanHA300_Chr13g0495971 [Helianthus annuus]KAJ0498943.1 hypothetical protein HanHA89_Chr13g0528611 [Helianthus annuus]KAJ0664958.1 hypothetical protein HanLR1_Chr13g0498641 [Helianthus annuus]KAJ0672378.1 hypothetical protein HanOQP8_Chr13g0496611 [Helianthus annuus]KAJ0859677.1 hypothetical protein HanRHA438_Chr13g0615321 [Helianthus annuus]